MSWAGGLAMTPVDPSLPPRPGTSSGWSGRVSVLCRPSRAGGHLTWPCWCWALWLISGSGEKPRERSASRKIVGDGKGHTREGLGAGSRMCQAEVLPSGAMLAKHPLWRTKAGGSRQQFCCPSRGDGQSSFFPPQDSSYRPPKGPCRLAHSPGGCM